MGDDLKFEHQCLTGPTVNLRWVARGPDKLSKRPHNILQQAFQCRACGRTEWLDVPLHTEDKDAEPTAV
jgi:hypothetical protein